MYLHKPKKKKKCFKSRYNDHQEDPSSNLFASCVCVSFAIEQTDEMLQGRCLHKLARIPSFRASPILFPYKPEISILLPPGILTRPISRVGDAPKGRTGDERRDGSGRVVCISIYIYTHEFGTNLPN